MVVREFKKCSILNDLDGTEDDFIWGAESNKEHSTPDDVGDVSDK